MLTYLLLYFGIGIATCVFHSRVRSALLSFTHHKPKGAEIIFKPVLVAFLLVFAAVKRINESHDPDHGQRAADYAATLRGKLFEIDAPGFHLLHDACAGHTTLQRSDDPTIGTCLDADRLDLWRVGITPDPQFMSTDFGRWLAQRSDLNYLFLPDPKNSHPGSAS